MAKFYNSFMTRSVKHLDPKSVEFTLYHADEIKEMSVVKVTVPVAFNALGLPMKGGLYDPVMGPLGDRGEMCSTCRRPFFLCPGHFGHIELPVPVFNPFFMKTVFSILRLACLECHQLQIPGEVRYLLIGQMELLDAGYVVEAQELQGKLISIGSCDSNPHTQAAASAFTKESVKDYVREVLGRSSTKTPGAEESKNVEVLRSECLAMAKEHLKQRKLCMCCKKPIAKIALMYNRLMTTHNRVVEGKIISSSTSFVTPEEARSDLRALWAEHKDFILAVAPVLKKIEIQYPTDVFFVEIVPVPPPKVRPVNFVKGKMNEHPQTLVFQQVLQHSIVTRQAAHIVKGGTVDQLSVEGQQLYETMSGATAIEKLHNAWQHLQGAVDHLVDADLNNNRKNLTTSPAGLKQVISKKEGLIRMHMMGKRVNYAARTVITPDPNLGVDEIGIPEAFAKVLTYPTPVTPWNVDDLRQAVLNGPDVYPGATIVQNEDGSTIRVGKDATQRASLAKRLLTPKEADGQGPSIPKIVHRHLRNGDVLLLNRQPTLHRPSIMAHRAHVLRGEKTFRLHYANCKHYNADFDGDEMNAHFPQSELARAEAYFLAQVGHHYLVPKDGTPLSGLIQDHVVSGVRLTVRGRFFSRAEYCTLVQQALPTLTGRIRLLSPSMLKPHCLWSGKQVVSTVILNCIPAGRSPPTLCDSAKINARAWVHGNNRRWRAGGTPLQGDALSEAEVVLREGELLCGVLDKKHFGSTPYGLAHCIYELYGAEYCMKLLSAFARLFTAFLQREGFTLGVRDILVIPEADAERRKILEEATYIGSSAIAAAFEISEPLPKDLNKRNEQLQLPPGVEDQLVRIATGDQQLRAALDHSYKKLLDPATNAVSRACVPAGLLEKFPENNLQLMVQSGAKGSTVNTLQISCLLGQIELEGRRPPLMPSGKALPSFCRFDPSPRAGGFVAGRFLTGIRPQEFFFHCMAGREGLIDTAVKTSRSGYLQRCLVKHLEGLVVGYDGTVRDSDGSVVQFAYGEDGLDILKSRFLTPKQIHVLADNYKAFYNKDDVSKLRTEFVDPAIETASKEVRRWIRRSKRSGIKRPPRVYKDFSHAPDPVASLVTPCAAFEALTERLDDLINNYLKANRSSPSEADPVREALLLKCVFARADPGEPVGVLAAQSIGEPSTQMTLNTFHFAGRGEMNMTLGIPRLREVLMMASRNPKTPAMEVPVRTDIPDMAASADSLRRRFRRSHLSELLEKVDITERLEVKPAGRQRLYHIRMQFLPKRELRREHSFTPNQVLKHVESKFISHLILAVRKLLRTTSALLEAREKTKEGQAQIDGNEDLENDATLRVTRRTRQQDGDHESSSEDEGEEEEDATSARNRARRNEIQEYDQPEGSEDELSNQNDDDDEDYVDGSFRKKKERNSSQSNGFSDIVEDLKKQYDLYQTDVQAKKRIENVLLKYKLVKSYIYDLEHEQWCEVTFGFPLTLARVDFSTVFREVAEQSVVCAIPGIRRAFVNSNPDGSLILRTDGTNLPALFEYVDMLDINKIYSNDIYLMSQTYGIEAARAVLVREVRDVFKAYGITVDPRHLLLVADYMTCMGTYEPLSKRGIESASSPLQQMSFESSISFLQTATLRGRRDALQSPSSRIMLGRPCNAGTGAFSLCQHLTVSE